LTIFFALLRSAGRKAAHKMLIKFTTAGLSGSPMFTKELNHKSFIQIFPGSKITAPPASKQLSILGWIRPDITDEGTVFVSFNKTRNQSYINRD
jgi:hypothetical protein